MDNQPYHFTTEQVEMIQTLSSHLSYVIELENAQQKIAQDIELAKQVQRSVLTPPIHDEKIEIEAIYLPSAELSGDMYCWYKIEQHRYGILLFDVMGHGVSSSLVCMSLRSLLHNLIMITTDPVKVLQELDEHMNRLYRREPSDFITYATVLYLVIDTEKNEIEYINAGHPPGLMLTNQTEIVTLEHGGPPIGVFSEITFSKYKISYTPNSKILLYTDGIFEFLEETISGGIEVLQDKLLQLKGEQNHKLIKNILKESEQNNVLTDDICLIEITLH